VAMIAVSAVVAGVESVRRLVDPQPLGGVDPALVDTAEAALSSVEPVRSVDQVRLRWVGHELHAEVRLGIDAHLTLAEGHDIAHQAEDHLATALPRLVAATVHVHPGRPRALVVTHRPTTMQHRTQRRRLEVEDSGGTARTARGRCDGASLVVGSAGYCS
jgi:divalent metal cation (Fe/Co/Zn/Cd) transporter